MFLPVSGIRKMVRGFVRVENAQELLEKTVDVLLDKAEDCLGLVKSQRASAERQQAGADEQQVSARKLEQLGQALAHNACDLKGELAKQSPNHPSAGYVTQAAAAKVPVQITRPD
jgi:hypothetical protein